MNRFKKYTEDMDMGILKKWFFDISYENDFSLEAFCKSIEEFAKVNHKFRFLQNHYE